MREEGACNNAVSENARLSCEIKKTAKREQRWVLPKIDHIEKVGLVVKFHCGDASYCLRALEKSDCESVAAWLQNPRQNEWMDFGNGRQALNALAISIMARSPDHFVRVVLDAKSRLIGVFGLQQVRHPFRVAQLWGVRPMLRPPARLRNAVAMRVVLSLAFQAYDLSAVQAWAVDGNLASIRILEELGFCACGRHRRCHPIGGVMRDRLNFDLLPEDFEPITDLGQSDGTTQTEVECV